MPNPVYHENSKEGRRMKRRLTPRQKAIVKKLRSKGLPVKLYRRAGARSGVSVHDPYVDMVRKANTPKKLAKNRRKRYKNMTKAQRARVKKSPHAYDTKRQQKATKKKVAQARASKGRVRKKSKYHSIFLP